MAAGFDAPKTLALAAVLVATLAALAWIETSSSVERFDGGFGGPPPTESATDSVASVFSDVFGRAPSTSELESYVEMLTGGTIDAKQLDTLLRYTREYASKRDADRAGAEADRARDRRGEAEADRFLCRVPDVNTRSLSSPALKDDSLVRLRACINRFNADVQAKEVARRGETVLAEYQSARDRDELRLACARATESDRRDADDRDGSDGRWKPYGPAPGDRRPPGRCPVVSTNDQTALVGTPLGDAGATGIGSIMPTFAYREATTM